MSEQFISRASTQNAYKEFEYTIPVGHSELIRYDFEYFRVLTMIGDNLFLRFGGNSQETSFVGVGIGYKLPEAVNQVLLMNKGNVPLTLKVALGMGDITDDRINFESGAGIPAEIIIPTQFATNQITVGTTETLLSAIDPLKKYVSIQAGDQDLFIGGTGVTTATGFKIQAGATYSLENTADIYGIIATSTDTVYVLEGMQ